jgi:hypothetical protein
MTAKDVDLRDIHERSMDLNLAPYVSLPGKVFSSYDQSVGVPVSYKHELPATSGNKQVTTSRTRKFTDKSTAQTFMQTDGENDRISFLKFSFG